MECQYICVRLLEVISYYSQNTDEMDKGDQGHCADVVFQGPRGLKTVIEVSKGQQGNVLLRHFKIGVGLSLRQTQTL